MPRYKVFAGSYLLLEVEAKDKDEVAQKVCEYNGITIYEENEGEENRQYKLFPKEDLCQGT